MWGFVLTASTLHIAPFQQPGCIRASASKSGAFLFGRFGQRLPDIFHVERIENADAMDVEPPLAAVEDRAGQEALDAQRLEPFELLDEIANRLLSGSDIPSQNARKKISWMLKWFFIPTFLWMKISMDTDDLSEMAWDIIARAAQVSDTLKVDLGARSGRYGNEDDWLRGVLKFLQKVVEDPDDYVDYWNLEQEEGVTAAMLREIATDLSRRAKETLAKPPTQRGKQG